MIKRTRVLLEEYSSYKNPKDKLSRLVKEKKLFPIIQGLYETVPNVDGKLLASSICSPSYLSFDYALFFYGLIPEKVVNFTSACYNKRKTKEYHTSFGCFIYHDIPKEAFPYGITLKKENEYSYQIATIEKAICDKLYSLSPINSQKELESLLFNDLRIDKNIFFTIDITKITFLSSLYKCKNIYLLVKYLKRRNK